MNPQVKDPPSHEPVAMATSPGFTPVCSLCQYDLSGLADGRCPECGSEFTQKQLWLLSITPQQRSFDSWSLSFFGLFCACLFLATGLSGFASMDSEGEGGLSMVLCFFCFLLWMMFRLRHLFETDRHELIWFVIPAWWLTAWLLIEYSLMLYLVPAFVAENLLLCAVVSLIADRKRVMLRASGISATYASLAAAITSIDYLNMYFRGHYWSKWKSLVQGDARPLNVDDFGWVALTLAVIAGGSLALFMKVAGRERLRRAWRWLSPNH